MDPAFPDIAIDLDGWRLAEETVETLFQVPGARVRGATRRFADVETREAVREATGGRLDREWRFVAATKLGFEPPLPPGAASMVLPMVRREARGAFAERLVGRGLENVSRRGRERLNVGGRTPARLTRFGAIDHVEDDVPVTGWVCVWRDGGDFFVVTGGYPEGPLADLLSLEAPDDVLDRTGADYREEFVDVVRAVA